MIRGVRSIRVGLAAMLSMSAMAVRAEPAASQILQVADSSFRHELHRDFTCLDCHTLGPGHGALRVQDVDDCRSCHHVAQREERSCSACHESSELANVVYTVDRVLSLSVRDRPARRSIDFSHAVHRERDCVECHEGGATLAVPDLDCQSCHEEHHQETVSGCMTCHEPAREGAHTLKVHESCSGSGCHVDPPFEAPPHTRVGCLWCHADREDHEPQDNCVECHLLSEIRGGRESDAAGTPDPGLRSPDHPEVATLPVAARAAHVRGQRVRGH